MSKQEKYFHTLYTTDGTFLGTFISHALWEEVQEQALPLLEKACAAVAEPATPPREPLEAWEELLECWDFPYPVNTEVHCDMCDQTSTAWEKDTPRKFYLTSCNIGGLVTFVCTACKARVIKRHFKDMIQTETVPQTK